MKKTKNNNKQPIIVNKINKKNIDEDELMKGVKNKIFNQNI